MTKRQITLPGMRKEKGGDIKEGTIRINLDDESGDSGLAINQRLYEHLVNGFLQQGSELRSTEKQFYLVNNQLLQVLLSAKECSGLLLSKCYRPEDKTESIAFIALNDKNMPISWKSTAELAAEVEGQTVDSDVDSGEWIQGFTIEQVRTMFLKNQVEGDEIDFDKFFEAIKTT